MVAFETFIAAGVDQAWYGTLDAAGLLKGGTKTAPVAGNAVGSPMLRLTGVQSADITIPQPDQVNIPGDNKTQGSFLFASEENPAFTIETGVFNQALQALEQGTQEYQEGGARLGVLAPVDLDPQDMCWILQSPTKKKDVGYNGLKAWHGYIIPASTAIPMGRNSFATRAGASDRHRVTANPASKTPSGTPIDETNFLTEGGAVIPFTSDYPIFYQRWTGDGTEDAFTMAKAAVANTADAVVVRVDGVKQVYTTDYTVSGSTLTFAGGSIPDAAAVIVAQIQYNP